MYRLRNIINTTVPFRIIILAYIIILIYLLCLLLFLLIYLQIYRELRKIQIIFIYMYKNNQIKM